MGRSACRGAIVACWLLVASCAPTGAELLVDLRTDLVPAAEFAEVELVLVPEGATVGRTVSHTATSAEDYVAAVRVADFEAEANGPTRLRVRLRQPDGALVLQRDVALSLSGRVVYTLVITRGCRGVVCPMAGGDASATTCFASHCVSPECGPGHTASCGTPECVTSADCTRTSPCATNECIDGACFARPIPGMCGPTEYCGAHGCVPLAGACVSNAPCDTGNPCELGRLDCTTGTGVCRAMGPAPSATPCRAAVDACDAPESCDGNSTACPPDGLAPAGTACGNGYCNGLGTCAPCTVGDACSTGNPCERGTTSCATGAPVCMAAGPASAGTICRPVAGPCDVAEACDGTSTTCPADVFETAGSVCRSAAAVCDAAETCSGSSASCPPDAVATPSQVCRPTSVPCDAPESCDGASLACPPDGAPLTTCTVAARSAGQTSYTVPAGCTQLHVRAWGAGGGNGLGNARSAAGGYGEGTIAVTAGDVFTIVVGSPGASAAGARGALGGVPGGGAGGLGGGSQGGGGGGGFSGVFRGTALDATMAIVIAGGGAGSGGGSSSYPGAGGGLAGESGSATGGTQTMGGGVGANAGGLLMGGVGENRGSGDGGGGGGGGLYGGGGGGSANTDAFGGGGGSGFVIGTATSPMLVTGSRRVAANATDPARMSAGDPGAPGAVLLECL